MLISRNRSTIVALVLSLLVAPGSVESRASSASVRLQSPNGGETLRRGEPVVIRWNLDADKMITGQNVALSDDGGETYALTVATALDPTTRTYVWVVPDSLPKGKRYRLRVVAYTSSGTVADDESDEDFRIKKQKDGHE